MVVLSVCVLLWYGFEDGVVESASIAVSRTASRLGLDFEVR